VVSVAKIRGCVRGASSESVLACDMRFASRENTRLGQPEVGVGVHPGGGGTERPPIWSDDGDTVERYGLSTGATRCGAERLRRRACAPDCFLRSACHRRREESHQPGLAAVRRPAPRLHHLL
jgi:hypothetical protein